MQHSEIRNSDKETLFKKVEKRSYKKYLLAATLKLRGFDEEKITFDFPVTALIGPNGSGKSSVLGSAGCAYKDIKPGTFFPKSTVGDASMSGWGIEYELIDKTINHNNLVKRSSNFRQAKWVRGEVADRDILFFGIERTVPAGEKARYKQLMRSTYKHRQPLTSINEEVAKQVASILGKSGSKYQVTKYGDDDQFFVGKTDDKNNGTTYSLDGFQLQSEASETDGKNEGITYSEFHFGAGESSIIRMVTKIEEAPENSLILIEEIENGLHPIATRRMVEYLIDVAYRKSIQVIFTTHSDYALSPLPDKAIWASINGKLSQGKLSVEALRAISGRVDKKLAIFVEDKFAKIWVDAILREKLGANYEQVEVHAVHGDGNAVKTHNGHSKNPSVTFKSLCIIDGDSMQKDDPKAGIYRLPGKQPELTVFDSIRKEIDKNIAILTVSCQRAPEAQDKVKSVINEIAQTNRDPHVIFNQIGIEIGFVPEAIIQGAFIALWIRQNSTFCETLSQVTRSKIEECVKY